jgi:hypothetical protein
MAGEIDWSDPIYSDYGGPSSTADNTVTTNTDFVIDPIYSDYGGETPDTTSYNSDGTINEGGTAYSGDLNSGSSLFSGAELARLFKDSPLLKTLGAVGIGKLADKLFDVQKGPGGYKGGIPDLVSSRQMLPIPKTMQNAAGQTVARRPGSGGVSYFTPNQYVTPAQAAAARAEQPMVQPTMQPYNVANKGIPAGLDDSDMGNPIYQKNNNASSNPMGGSASTLAKYFEGTGGPMRPQMSPSSDVDLTMPYVDKPRQDIGIGDFMRQQMAAKQSQVSPAVQELFARGGITTLGKYSDGGRLLRGPGDGVSDSIPATIGKDQPARLADGEFVIPARIVSELGNGSTEAGARKLYAMMDRIKKARSKAKNIAADTKSDKHLPA